MQMRDWEKCDHAIFTLLGWQRQALMAASVGPFSVPAASVVAVWKTPATAWDDKIGLDDPNLL
jgi:hypothetical protein